MSQTAVDEILLRIEQLTDEERALLEERPAELAETRWQQEAERARGVAKQQGLDQAAIDRAVVDVRYRP